MPASAMANLFRHPVTDTIRRAAAAMLATLLADCAMAPAALAQQTPAARGEYLARAGDCVSCHTATGGSAYAGGGRLDTCWAEYRSEAATFPCLRSRRGSPIRTSPTSSITHARAGAMARRPT